MTDVLKGIRVLEVATYAFVPSAAAVLSDWGADVIKVEQVEHGDPMRGTAAWGIPGDVSGFSYLWEVTNRGKRAVAVNIDVPEGRDIILELARNSDVFLTNLMPDARKRLKIEVDDIVACNPTIIYARGSGQGQNGPDANKGGFDGISYWSRTGVALSATAPGADWPSPMPGPGFGDVQSGVALAGGIAAALFYRERTGIGVVVDTSLYGMGLWAMQPTIVAANLIGEESVPYQYRDMAANPISNTYRTSDGRFITLAMLQSDRYWHRLCEVLDRVDLAEDARFASFAGRAEHAVECIRILTEVFSLRTLTQWIEILSSQAGPWSILQEPAESARDQQAILNGYVQDVDYGDGRSLVLVTAPVQFDGTPPMLRPAPAHGAHTDEVLLEMGLDWDQIIALKLKDAVN